MKLIKINSEFYIINDHEIKPYLTYNENNDVSIVLHLPSNTIIECNGIGEMNGTKTVIYSDPMYGREVLYKECRNITHSTEGFRGVIKLNKSEICELVGEFNVEKLALELDKSKCRNFKREFTSKETYDGIIDGYILGFNKHEELTKDKLYTEEDVYKAIEMARENSPEIFNHPEYGYVNDYTENDIITALQPKTEWDITIENGKIQIMPGQVK